MSSPSSEFVSQLTRAGAGAGKTYDLIEKVKNLVLSYPGVAEGQYPRLVVTTFTRKATQEIKERLMKKSLDMQKDNDPSGKLLQNFITNSGHLHVSTIHGVLSLYLMRFGKNIGLDPQFKFLNHSKSMFLSKMIFKRLVESSTEWLDLIEVYGISRLVEIIGDWIQAYRFDNTIKPQTIEHLKQRRSQKLSALYSQLDPLISSLEIKIDPKKPGEFIKYIEMLKNIKNIFKKTISEGSKASWDDEQPQLNDIYEARPKSIGGAMRKYDSNVKELRASVADQIEELLSVKWLDQTISEFSENSQKIERIAREFLLLIEDEKLRLGQIEMSDLELLSLRLIEEFPETAKTFSEEWDYWFIDEYQDTSPVQVKLLNALVHNKPHYIVGDPQQSIYLFRGARTKVFHEKQIEFEKGGFRAPDKTINRRSSPELLHFINDLVVSVNHQQFGKMQPHILSDDHHKPDRIVADFIVCDNSDQVSSSTSASNEVESDNEVNAILDRMIELLSSQNVNPSDIAVLCRKNDELIKIAQAAKKKGIPVQLQSGGRFYKNPEIRDSLLILRFLLNPHDNTNFVALLRSPWFKLSDTEIVKMTTKTKSSQNMSFWVGFENTELKSILEKYLVDSSQFGISETLLQILKEREIFELCAWVDPSGRRESSLWKFIEMMRNLQNQGSLSYNELLSFDMTPSVDERESDAVSVSDPNRVHLMTVHASKGLEFDHVILPFANKKGNHQHSQLFRWDEDNGLWTIPIIDSEKQTPVHNDLGEQIADVKKQNSIDEDERLLYVAVTRAKETLTFIWSEDRTKDTEDKADKPSKSDKDNVDLLSQNESWIHKIRGFDLSNVGVFNAKNSDYKYRFRIYPFEVSSFSYSTKEKSNFSVRAPYISSNANSNNLKVQKVSVTDLVHEDLEFKSKENSTTRKRSSDSIFNSIIAANNGTSLHRLFESLKFRDIETVVQSQTDIEIKKILNNLLSFENIPVLEIIKNGEVEWGFQVDIDNKELEGQIDLWGRDNAGRIWIVDYKTGSTDYLEQAYKQLEIYARALKQCQKIKTSEEIRLAVLYPVQNESFIRIIDYTS